MNRRKTQRVLASTTVLLDAARALDDAARAFEFFHIDIELQTHCVRMANHLKAIAGRKPRANSDLRGDADDAA